MSYATFKAVAADLERKLSDASATLSDIRNRKAIEHGIPPFGTMGITPDAIKFSPEYRAASYRLDQCFAALRRFNGQHAARFQKEIRADINARRQSRLAKV